MVCFASFSFFLFFLLLLPLMANKVVCVCEVEEKSETNLVVGSRARLF